MKKTFRMELIELKRGQPLETLIPALYERLGTTPAVARDLGISQVALYRWVDLLGLELRTESRVIVTSSRSEQPVG